MTTPTPSPRHERPGSTQDNSLDAVVQADGGADTTENLVALLEQQCGLYEKLKELSDQQSRLVIEGAPEPLLQVLASRQRLIDELTRVNSGLLPYRSKWDEYWGSLNEPDRQRIGALIQKVEGMLGGIIEQDNHDRQRLEEATGSIREELAGTTHASAAMQAYKVQPSEGGGRFTDRQG